MKGNDPSKIPVYKLSTKDRDKEGLDRSFQELEKEQVNDKDVIMIEPQNRMVGQQYPNSYVPNMPYSNPPVMNHYNQPYPHPHQPYNNYNRGHTDGPRPLNDLEMREKKRREGLEDDYNCDFWCGFSIGFFFGILAFLCYCFNPHKQYKKGIIIGAVVGTLIEIIIIIIAVTT